MKHFLKKQKKRMICWFCGKKTFYWGYDPFILWLKFPKSEARMCESCYLEI